MIAQEALQSACGKLRLAGVSDPIRDVRILLAHALGIPLDRLTLHLTDPLNEQTLKTFHDLVSQREQRQPVSQIIGTRQFYGRSFRVTPDVLDPRPETETLVAEAIAVNPTSVMDVGTGSGCLLLSILAESKAQGLGLDISRAALNIVKENAKLLDLESRTTFKQSDWFSQATGAFDLIVSNPPYIDEAEWQTLDPEPRLWEPKIALTPGEDGLQPYRILADQAGAFLSSQGWLMVEIGWQQGDSVTEIFSDAGWQNVEVVQDLGGKDRVVKGQKP